jgi:transcriptional regulator GlxA family with amidase domain
VPLRGQAPYLRFQANFNHADSAVRGAQAWLSTNYARPHAVEEAMRTSGLAERIFKRLTGITPSAIRRKFRIPRVYGAAAE